MADFYLWYGRIATDLWYGNTSVTKGDYYAVAARADWHPTPKKILPLNEATSLTVDTFYETFQQSGVQTGRLETPTSLWPEYYN